MGVRQPAVFRQRAEPRRPAEARAGYPGCLQTFIDTSGASWTAWVTDNSWWPPLFNDANLTQLSHFGSLTKTWLAAKAASDWVM